MQEAAEVALPPAAGDLRIKLVGLEEVPITDLAENAKKLGALADLIVLGGDFKEP
jgi:hypothetical protein